MRLKKLILIFILSTIFLFGKGEEIDINFKNLEIIDLIKIVSKILEKNILLEQDVLGKVDFVSNKPVNKEDVFNILKYTLEAKGFTIIDDHGILRLVKINVDTQKYTEEVKVKNLQAVEIQADLITMAKTLYNEQIETEKVTILLNKETNSLIFVGKEKNVKYLVNYLKTIDAHGSLIAKTVEVIALKNAEAKAIMTIISGIITNQQQSKNSNNKPYISVDEESNSIILMGQKNLLAYYKELIEQLDTDKQQVYVQARIIEVSEKGIQNVGLKYGIDGFQSGSGGLATFSSTLNNGISSLGKINQMGGLDLNTMTHGLALGITVNLLNQNGAADILSEPSLLCINNKQSSIYVGETRSIKTGTTTTTGGNVSENYVREDIGLTLKVKPRISTGDKVTLEITTKLEDVGQTLTNGQPDTSKKDITTTAIVNHGESIILGGYIKEKNEIILEKIPLLGDIPFIGALFKNSYEIKDKINLVVIITPYIVPKTKDLTYIRNQLVELKILEDKFTKDTILRLEKTKLKAHKEGVETNK